MITRRLAVLAALVFAIIFLLFQRPDFTYATLPEPSYLHPAVSPAATVEKDGTITPLPASVLTYFDQIFSVDQPSAYEFRSLRQYCERTKWQAGDVYLQCVGMAAGVTSIVSQVKVCLKMALEAGTGVVLPSMPLRDSDDLKNFNFLNQTAYMSYDKWFEASHLIEQVGRVCPRMRFVHPDDLDTPLLPVKFVWKIDVTSAPGYQALASYFWTGRPFNTFFENKYVEQQQLAFLDPARDDSKKGITVLQVYSQFLLFRITDDPTRQELKLWNDLSHLIRFKEEPRRIVHQLLSAIPRPFYGVHFRVEADTIWSGLENQLSLDLDALDTAWAKYGTPGAQKPLVYLACGDQEQIEKFVVAGKARGWEVTHKWELAQSNPEVLKSINDLPFDFQGAVDMGMMLKSHFFLGITGSAFSSTIANARDPTGRYRGSSFLYEDENARTHLFNDNDAVSYACCL